MRIAHHRALQRPGGAVLTCLALAAALTALLLARPLFGLAGLLWLAAALLLGRVLVARALPFLELLPALAGSVVVGLVVATWLSFALASALDPVSDNAVMLGGLLTIWVAGLVAWRHRRRLPFAAVRRQRGDLAVMAGAGLFAAWLFSFTLSADPVAGNVTIAAGGWPDFGLHLAIARSFSLGQNLPTQYPLFAGPSIQYHFGFDFLAGLLERQGLSLPTAFNLPAILGMTALLTLLFHLGRTLSGRTFGGAAAMLLGVLNSSWAFVDYVKLWPASPPDFVRAWWEQADKLQTGPWNPAREATWQFTLSALLHQRQLTLGIAAGLFVVAVLLLTLHAGRRLSADQVCLLGAFLALTFPLNAAVYVAVLGTGGLLLLAGGRIRAAIDFGLFAVMPALPMLLLMSGDEGPKLLLGYIVRPLTFTNFVTYWWEQTALLPLLALAAIVVVRGRSRWLLLVLWAPFIAGNTVQFSHSLSGTNHKLFNVWVMVMAVTAGVFLGRLSTMGIPGHRGRQRGGAVHLPPFSPGETQATTNCEAEPGDTLPPATTRPSHLAERTTDRLGAMEAGPRAASATIAGPVDPDEGPSPPRRLPASDALDAALAALGVVRRPVANRAAPLTLPAPGSCRPRLAGTVLALALLTPSVASGLVDIAFVKNERHHAIIGDNEAAVAWIARETPPDAVFLTQPWLYVPPSIAGRVLYLGYAGWAADAGYDVDTRGRMLERIYRSETLARACALLRQEGIDYVQVGPAERGGDKPLANTATWELFRVAHESYTSFGPLRYYDVDATCK